MSYETRAYDKPNDDGFPPDPVAVVVATGTHDVSRLVHLLNGGQVLIEQLLVGRRLREQVRRHNAGQAALKLLRQHGGPDFTDEQPTSDRLCAAVFGINGPWCTKPRGHTETRGDEGHEAFTADARYLWWVGGAAAIERVRWVRVVDPEIAADAQAERTADAADRGPA